MNYYYNWLKFREDLINLRKNHTKSYPGDRQPESIMRGKIAFIYTIAVGAASHCGFLSKNLSAAANSSHSGDDDSAKPKICPLPSVASLPPDGPNDDDDDEDLFYKETRKHEKNSWGTEMDLDASTAQKVLNASTRSGRHRYGWHGGRLHEFQYDNAGTWHGYPIPRNQAPTSVPRGLRAQGIISNSEYNAPIRGKM